MIRSFQHRGLAQLYAEGSARGLRASHVPRLRRILSLLDQAATPEDLMIPTYRTHKLSGRLKGYWSMTVNGNWRVVFRFSGKDVERVDYVDYH